MGQGKLGKREREVRGAVVELRGTAGRPSASCHKGAEGGLRKGQTNSLSPSSRPQVASGLDTWAETSTNTDLLKLKFHHASLASANKSRSNESLVPFL